MMASKPGFVGDLKNPGTLRRVFLELRPEWKLLAGTLVLVGVGSATSLAVPVVTGKLVDASYGRETELSGLIMEHPFASCTLAFGFFAFRGGTNFARETLSSVAGERLALRLRNRMLTGAARRETSYLGGGGLSSGDLQTRIVGDVGVVQKATFASIKLVRSAIMLAAGIPVLIYTSPTLSAASLCTLPPLAYAARKFGTTFKQRQVLVQNALSDASTISNELAEHFKLIRQFGGENAELERFNIQTKAVTARAVEADTLENFFDFGVDTSSQVAIIGVIATGLYQVRQGTLSPGDLSSFVMLSLMVANNAWSVTTSYTRLMRGAAAAERIFELSGTTAEENQHHTHLGKSFENVGRPPLSRDIYSLFNGSKLGRYFDSIVNIDSAATLPPLSHPVQQAGLLEKSNELLRFEDVFFGYDDQTTVLKGVTLSVKRGDVIALCGTSGSGKSTVSKLTSYLYAPARGRIYYNGIDIRDVMDLRARIAIVDQDHALLTGTVQDNVKYGNRKATKEQVEEAIRLACADDFVTEKGLDFQVGVGGRNLSGGQRQRIALARAILKVISVPDCDLLFLDEALSSLDRKNAKRIWKNLLDLKRDFDLTLIHVTHQGEEDLLTMVKRIVRLDHGVVSQDTKIK